MTPKELYEAIGGDYEAALRTMMMDAMIGRIILKLPDDTSYARLMRAAETMDEKGLFEAAHAMKGVYANLGLNNIASLASEITEEFRPGTERTLSDEEVRGKLAEIKALQERTMEKIAEFRDSQ